MDYGFQETAALLGISSRMLGKWSAYFASFLSLADQAVPDADGGAAGRRYTEADIATLRQVKQLRAARLTYEQVHARLEALHTASGADQTSPQGKQAGVADAQAPVEDAARDPSAQPEAAQGAMSAFLQLPPELQDELNQLRPDQPEPAPHEEAPPVAPARALPPPAQPAVPGDQPGMLPREWTAVGARFPSAPAALRNHPAAQSRPQQSLDAHEGTRDEGYAQKKTAIGTPQTRNWSKVRASELDTLYRAVGNDGRLYAVKEIPDQFTDPQERAAAIERFEAEVRRLQSLSHPRIPHVYAYFREKDRHYLTMEFVQGQNLAEIVERQGALPGQQVLAWADQLCDALGYLHANGIIYRELSPANMVVDEQYEGIRLIDFGVARLLQPPVAGALHGTPGFAPPEQYEGVATPATDIYALGATLHYLLTGHNPAKAHPFLFPDLRDLQPGIAQRTADAIQRALRTQANDRFQSIEEFRAALLPGQASSDLALRPAADQTAGPLPDPAMTAAIVPATPERQLPPRSLLMQSSRSDTLPHPAVQPRTAPVAALPPPAQPPADQPPAGQPPAARSSTLQSSAAQSTPLQPSPARSSAARPATARPQQPAAAPTQAPERQRRFGSLVLIGVTIAALGIVAIVIAMLFAPTLLSQPTPTPQVLIAQPFTLEHVEIIVPPETDNVGLRQAFVYAFTQAARAKYGPGVQVDATTLAYIHSEPEKTGTDPRGVRYRASMQGTILVPR